MADWNDDKESVESLVGKILARSKESPTSSNEAIEERLRERLANAPPPRRKLFDPLFSTSTVVTILLALCAGATATVGWVMRLQGESYEFRRDIQEIKRYREADAAEANKVRLTYVPRIEGTEREVGRLNSENNMQNNRIENVIESIRDMRKGNDMIMAALNALQLDVAFIKASLPASRRRASVETATGTDR